MKNFTFTITALMMFPMLSSAQQVGGDPTIDRTYSNWSGRNAIYDLSIAGPDARTALSANKDVIVNNLESWSEANGDFSRYHWQGGSDETVLNTPGLDGGLCQDGDNGQALFSIYQSWWQGWGWIAVNQQTPVDISHFTEDTHIHFAVKPLADVLPQPMNVKMFCNPNGDSDPGCIRFSLASEDFQPEGRYVASYPVIAGLKKGEWTGIDITIGDLEKILKEADGTASIDYARFTGEWKGHVVQLNTPIDENNQKVNGAHFALNGIYFYTPTENAGVGNIQTDRTCEIVVSDKTISVVGGEGIEIWSLTGRKMAAAAGSVIGIESLAKGMYVVRAAGMIRKIVLK